MSDLDSVIDRSGTSASKWMGLPGVDPPMIPMSVADMEFAVPPAVHAAVQERASHGIFGYTSLEDNHNDVVRDHLGAQGWWVDSESIVYTHRILEAVKALIQIWSDPGDRILMHVPGYYPLVNTIRLEGREPVLHDLVERDGRYEVDFTALEAAFQDGVRILIWCSPQNPTGRVWTRPELERLADLCVRFDVRVISDDVHADFTWKDHEHIFLAGLGEQIANLTATCTSPAKTFNVPGLEIAHTVLPKNAREAFREAISVGSFHNPSLFAGVVTRAAYLESLDWLDQVRRYIGANLIRLGDFLAENLTELRLIEPEGTYLAWIDARAISSVEANLKTWVAESAHVAVSWGSSFGADYEGFFRLNLALPRTQLDEALKRLAATK